MPVVKLYANLRKLAGRKEVPVSGGTVAAAINDLVHQHQPLHDALLQNGELRPHVIVTLNGRSLVSLDVPTTEEDVIAIFPPIAGGARETRRK